MADAAAELEAALAATAAALDAADAEGAAEASGRAARACTALEAVGARLTPAQLARLTELQGRCQATAGQVMAKLAGELAGAARSSRAVAAYRR